MTRWRLLLIFAVSTLAACAGGDDGVKCSFKNPIAVDEGPDQWPKFRRDSQNTGTIRVSASAYETIASTTPRAVAWTFPRLDQPPKGPFVASPSLTVGSDDDRRIYIGSVDANLYVMQARDGSPFTTLIGEGVSFAAVEAITSTATVGVLDERDAVVVGTGDARLVGVDVEGIVLAQVWPFIGDGFIRNSPAMGVDGLFLTATLGGGLAGVCPNGVGRFGVSSGSTESSAAVGHDPDTELDGTFYIGSSDRILRAVRSDGVVRWTFSMSAPIISSPVVELSADGTRTTAIYVADVSGLVSKVTNVGRPVPDFSFVRGSIGATQSSPALTEHPVGGKRLYVGSDDGNLYAVDAGTGDLIWSFGTGGFIRSSPAVVLNAAAASDPIVIVGSFDGTLYYVRDTGDAAELVSSFRVPENRTSPDAPRAIESSPAVGADGSVYFGADDGRVYAVR